MPRAVHTKVKMVTNWEFQHRNGRIRQSLLWKTRVRRIIHIGIRNLRCPGKWMHIKSGLNFKMTLSNTCPFSKRVLKILGKNTSISMDHTIQLTVNQNETCSISLEMKRWRVIIARTLKRDWRLYKILHWLILWPADKPSPLKRL